MNTTTIFLQNQTLPYSFCSQPFASLFTSASSDSPSFLSNGPTVSLITKSILCFTTLFVSFTPSTPTESIQCFSHKKTAVAVTHYKRSRRLIKINGVPIEFVEPEILRYKAFEPVLLLGRHRFAGVDMRIRVKGGGHTSQIYAIRQGIAKALVAYYDPKREIKDILVRYDRTLLVADPGRCEPKKFGGHGARARLQKSYH